MGDDSACKSSHVISLALLLAFATAPVDANVILRRREGRSVILVDGQPLTGGCCFGQLITLRAEADVPLGDIGAALRLLSPASASIQLVPIGHASEHEPWVMLQWPARDAAVHVRQTQRLEETVKSVIITDGKAGLFVNGEAIDRASLAARLRRELAKRPDAKVSVVLAFEGTFALSHAVPIVELAHRAGAQLAVNLDVGPSPLRRRLELTREARVDKESAAAALQDLTLVGNDKRVVDLLLFVEGDGTFRVTVERSSGDASLDESVVMMARAFRVQPAEAPPSGCVFDGSSTPKPCAPATVRSITRHRVTVLPPE